MASRIIRDPSAFQTSRRARDIERISDPRHLAWVASLPSVINGEYGCEAAHINYADKRFGKPERAKGKKTDDCYVLPLTPAQHRTGPQAQHKTGKEREWWERHGIDATTIARDLWRVSGDTAAAIEILKRAKRR